MNGTTHMLSHMAGFLVAGKAVSVSVQARWWLRKQMVELVTELLRASLYYYPAKDKHTQRQILRSIFNWKYKSSQAERTEPS